MDALSTIFASVPQYLAACAVLALAQAVYVLFGFGAGLIAVGLMVVFIPEVKDVVVLLLLVNLPAEVFVVLTSRRVIAWRGVAAICAGMALGVPLGAWILKRAQPTAILLLLGAFLLVTGLAFLAAPARRTVRWPRWVPVPLGTVAGLLGGMFGTSGPPVILYYQLSGAAKASFRGNLMAIFMVVTLVRAPSYAVAGLITPDRLRSALAILPAALLGAWLGQRIHLRLSEDAFRRLVSAALAVIGLLVLSRELL